MTSLILSESDLAALDTGVRTVRSGIDEVGPVLVPGAALGPATVLPAAVGAALAAAVRAAAVVREDLDDCSTAIALIGTTFAQADDAIARKAQALR